MNLATALELAALRYPETEAIITDAECFSYYGWNRRVNSVSWGLIKAGIRPGDRVAICTTNGEAPATMYFAVQRAGAAAVLLNARWKHQEMAYAINEAAVKAILFDATTKSEVMLAVHQYGQDLVCIEASRSPFDAGGTGTIYFEELAGKPADEVPEIPLQDLATGTILYTSGTTGRPKGVCRSPRSDYFAALGMILEHRWERFERTLAVMPLYHTMGLHTLISMVLLNGTSVMLPRVDPAECIKYMESERITALYLVPTIYHDLVEVVAGFRHRDLGVSKLAYAGAPMSASLVRKCRTIFDPRVFVNQYGCTEMHAITINHDPERNPLSVGRPSLHSRIRIVTADRNRRVPPTEALPQGMTGELIVHAASPQAFTGYLNQPEVTEQVLRDGWYFTGDLAFMDHEGNLYLVGRVDDMIISGGENIYPAEVEQILLGHSQVKEAAVVGMADKRWGESVTAFIVPAAAELDHRTMERFCLEHPGLARYKRPRQFVFVKEIPKSPTGKILRSLLKQGRYTP